MRLSPLADRRLLQLARLVYQNLARNGSSPGCKKHKIPQEQSALELHLPSNIKYP